MWVRYFLLCLRSGDADGVLASKAQHAVQSMDDDVHLGWLTLSRMRAQLVADHLLEPADSRLGPGADGMP